MPLEIVPLPFFTPDFASFLGVYFFFSTFLGLALDAVFFSVAFFGDFFAGFVYLPFLVIAGLVLAGDFALVFFAGAAAFFAMDIVGNFRSNLNPL